MDKPCLQFSFQKLEKNSIFAFIQYVKESNFHNIAISYLGGGKWEEERESYFFYKAILQNDLVTFFIKSVKILNTFVENSLILTVSL